MARVHGGCDNSFFDCVRKEKYWFYNIEDVESEMKHFRHSEEDLRYITDDDLISSDDIDSNDSLSNIPTKYNQLNPKADFVYKLLKSAKPKGENIWKETNFVPRIDNVCNNLNSNTVVFLKSASTKMAKCKKRKHDDLSPESDSYSPKKKAKKHFDRSPKKVRRKERTHSMSSSNNEDADVLHSHEEEVHYKPIHSTPVSINGTVRPKSKSSHLKNNSGFEEGSEITHVQNQESDLDNDLISSSEEIDNETPPNTKSQLEQNYGNVLETNESYSDDNLSTTCFTVKEAEEAITKYSFLLDDNLLQNYNFYNMQCPYYINNNNLRKQCLNLEENCSLEDGENKLEAYLIKNSKKRLTTLAVPCGENNFKQFRIPIVGNIIVEQSVEKIAKADVCIAETPQFVEFPENLRTRHPLLGLDYEDQPKTVVFKKSHKKKQSKTHSLEEDGYMSQELNTSTEYFKKKKHKKHKKDIKVEQLSEDDSYATKHKKKKHKRSKEND